MTKKALICLLVTLPLDSTEDFRMVSQNLLLAGEIIRFYYRLATLL